MDFYTDHNGIVRRLGYKAPSRKKLVLRASRTNIQKLRTDQGLSSPLIQMPDWTECDYVTGFPSELINDQGQEGACVGASGTGASARQRYMRTGEVINLSWQFLYDQINHGEDNGANIIDSMNTLEQVGVPLMSAYPKSLFVANKIPAGTTMYREDVACTITNSIEAATALIMGMLVQVPIYANNNFEIFTKDGVAWNGMAPKGNASNHSIYLAGLKKINVTWFFILVNSWGLNWGPFKNGTCLIPLQGVDNPSMTDDGYAHASTPAPDGSAVVPPLAAV